MVRSFLSLDFSEYKTVFMQNKSGLHYNMIAVDKMQSKDRTSGGYDEMKGVILFTYIAKNKN